MGIMFDIHSNLGKGFSEIVYKDAIEYELNQLNIPFEREKELELLKKQEEDLHRQQDVIKAKAVVSVPVQVGKIDLEPKKVVVPQPEKIVEVKPTPVAEVVKPEPIQPKPIVQEEKVKMKIMQNLRIIRMLFLSGAKLIIIKKINVTVMLN